MSVSERVIKIQLLTLRLPLRKASFNTSPWFKRTDFLPLPCAAESLLLSAAPTSGACAVPGTVPACAVRCAGQSSGLKVQPVGGAATQYLHDGCQECNNSK